MRLLETLVSNPHRYGQRSSSLLLGFLFIPFQTLIGTVKGIFPSRRLSFEHLFQTLIGTVKGRA